MNNVQTLDVRAVLWDKIQNYDTGMEWYPSLSGWQKERSTTLDLILIYKGNWLVIYMEMMSHLWNSKCRKLCIETEFKKKKEKKICV